MAREKRVLVIGFGNMGQALTRGWLAKRVPAAIEVVDPVERSRAVATELGLEAFAALDERGTDRLSPDVVVLAVKPKDFEAALEASRSFAASAVFVSIAAGRPIRSMLDVLGDGAAVVRAMPNTPAAIGQGMTVLSASGAVTSEQRAVCGELLAAVGAVAWIEDERQMDAVTAVSGSGPAYVFLLIECLERAAMELGLEPDLARELATVTVAGAGAYARASPDHAPELRRRVTSPGGTTEAALAILGGEGGLDHLLRRAVRAAEQRSRELSR